MDEEARNRAGCALEYRGGIEKGVVLRGEIGREEGE